MHLATISGRTLRQKPRTAYYAGQKRLFVAVILLVAVLPLVAVNWQTASLYRDSWMDRTALELASFASSRKELIDLFLVSQENVLAGFTEVYPLEWLSRKENLAAVFKVINKNGMMTDLGVIDASGAHLAYVGPFADKLAGKNYRKATWFHETMKNGRYISDIFTGYRGIPHLVVAVADAEKRWVLRATINSELFNGLVASATVGPGGDAFIISRTGEFQTPSRLGQQRLPADTVNSLAEIASGGSGCQRIGQHLYSVAALNSESWLLVLQTDIKSSLRDFSRARTIGIVIIFCAALLILLVTQLLIRSLVNRIDRAEQQRMELSNKVREVEKMALIGRLAASVAHEINNPLQVIGAQAGWASELLDEGADRFAENEAECRLALEKIREQVKRAGGITRRLLGFSRMQEAAPAVIDINQTVEDTILLLEKDAKSNGITISRRYDGNLPRVKTDAAQLQQVFLNILNNAVDAIGADGTIDVTTMEQDAEIRIEFGDSGPGIPESVLETIFTPFFTTKERGKGTGLGLAISSNIMQRLHGSLRAGNRPQGGGVFIVSLPVGTGNGQGG